MKRKLFNMRYVWMVKFGNTYRNISTFFILRDTALFFKKMVEYCNHCANTSNWVLFEEDMEEEVVGDGWEVI
jgi:hypothetical protein